MDSQPKPNKKAVIIYKLGLCLFISAGVGFFVSVMADDMGSAKVLGLLGAFGGTTSTITAALSPGCNKTPFFLD